MRLILNVTVALAAVLGLAACDAADRAALSGARAPAPVAAPSPAAPAVANAALLFPPAASAPAPRLRHASAAPRRHGLRRLAAAPRRAQLTAYAAQTVTRRAYAEADRAQTRVVRTEAEDRWDERREAFAEGYGADRYGRDGLRGDFRRERGPAAAGRDRDGFLTWPGKIPDHR